MREMTYTEDDCLADTQPIVPIQHQLIETDLHAAHPLLDDVDRLMDHFEDSQFMRLWAGSLRARYGKPRLERPY